MKTLFLDRLGDERREIVGGGASDRLVAEAADPIELGLAEPVEQQREILFGLAGEPDNEGRADGEAGACLLYTSRCV